MVSVRHSVVFRLAVGYSVLVALTVGIAGLLFYSGTAGLLTRNVDHQILLQARHLHDVYDRSGRAGVMREIDALLHDDKDIETEEYLLLGRDGAVLAGNLSGSVPPSSQEEVRRDELTRNGRPAASRYLTETLSDGSVLVVGHDMRDLDHLVALIQEALVSGSLIALGLSVVGATFFWWRMQRHLDVIRRTTQAVGEGRLRARIDAGNRRDEFGRIARDINQMLDSIERLMESARTISNGMAHELRTPLSRARATLENCVQGQVSATELMQAMDRVIGDIDQVSRLVGKLLQLSEAETGVRRRSFELVNLGTLAADLVDLFEPAALEVGQTLELEMHEVAIVRGDRELLSNAAANLLDNAIRYAGRGARLKVVVARQGVEGVLAVEDNGVGMSPDELIRAGERFYRGRSGRHVFGTGLGLAMVRALATLHGGSLVLADAQPGVRAEMRLPLPA